MIAALRGTLLYKTSHQAVLDVGGVGYEVFIAPSVSAALPETGESCQIFVQTIVREDALMLYGFATLEEKELFLLLTSVAGVGPKLALAVLGGLGVSALRLALASRDLRALSSVAGVGKKTAERLCVELADKLGALETAAFVPSHQSAITSGVSALPYADAASALVNLGYPEQAVWQSLRTIERSNDKADEFSLEEWIRQGLRALSTRKGPL